MIKPFIVLSIFLFLVSNMSPVFSQTDNSACKVLMESISDEYSGACKDGLANGNGEAKGVDQYSGKFKAGLPHGNGTYTWANGDYYIGKWKAGKKNGRGKIFKTVDNKITSGIWKEDKLVKVTTKPYKVLKMVNVSHVRIKKNIEAVSGTINIIFNIPSSIDFFSTLDMESSSGYEVKSMDYTAFEQITFPFEAEISFIVSGKSFIVTERCVVSFTIFEEGAWTVIIDHLEFDDTNKERILKP